MTLDSVTVGVPARLHLGFLDLSGSLGRKFGSIGLSVREPATRLTLRRARARSVIGPDHQRAERHLAALAAHLKRDDGLALSILSAIPAHAGLGSGTQLALAVAAGFRALHGLPLDPRGDAARLERGERSGVGIGLFETGGLVVDGGRGGEAGPAPIVSRLRFPDEWRVILMLDPQMTGIHGPDEVAAFARLPPFPEATAGHLCRRVLMQALPAAVERDIRAFGAAIADIQAQVGDYFAPAQGARFASPRVACAAAFLEAAGAHGCGQSSWGPTGFAFAASAEDARRLVAGLSGRADLRGLDVRITAASNQGAAIVPDAAASVA